MIDEAVFELPIRSATRPQAFGEIFGIFESAAEMKGPLAVGSIKPHFYRCGQTAHFDAFCRRPRWRNGFSVRPR